MTGNCACFKTKFWPDVVGHTFNSSTWESEAGNSEFETSLLYKVDSRTVRAVMQRNSVLKNQENFQ